MLITDKKLISHPLASTAVYLDNTLSHIVDKLVSGLCEINNKCYSLSVSTAILCLLYVSFPMDFKMT